jgi:4-amino-4-deoxy-L-arabinose transferase-like glycosyltransferase
MLRFPRGLLAALTLLRLIVAATTPLAPDEAYYWVWSRALAPGYPDHPPMVALWIRLGTMLAGDGALGVRLLGPLSVAIASLLLADAAERLLPGRKAGLHAAALLNATLLFGVGAVIMTPDTPLLFFWTCCLWALTRLLLDGNAMWWPVIGVFAGLAMASKYTAVLLWFGIALWLVITPSMRVWLRRPGPWLGALLGIAVLLPVLLWNAEHDWASFARQGGRVGAWQPANAVRFLAELVAGQIGLVTPLIFVFFAGGIVLAARQAWRTRDPVWTLLASLTLPAIVLFTEHALGDRVQGNWPAIIYPAAGIAAAGLTWRRLFAPALALGFGITLMVYAQTSLALLPLPTRLDPIALRLAGWDELAAEVEAVRQREGASFVACDQYGVAAELARSLPAGVAVVGIEPLWARFDLPHASLVGQRGILVRSGRDGDQPEIAEVPRRRGVDVVQTYRTERINGTESAVLLPRR